jgi:NDP-sugar pyrophosphorylase family protein
MDVDLGKLWESYTKAGMPACMLLPTKVRDGFDGDYIEKRDDGQIVRLDRANRTDIIGSGCQVLNPHQVASLTSSSDDFLEVWAKLMEQGQLYSADFTVQNWFTFDTVEQLKSYRALKDI